MFFQEKRLLLCHAVTSVKTLGGPIGLFMHLDSGFAKLCLPCCQLPGTMIGTRLSGFLSFWRGHFWDRLAVLKLGPPTKSSFVSLLQVRNGPKNGTVSRSRFWDRLHDLLNGFELI